ncbi:MAG: hypothetical protein M1828_004386 [Chrysothrix sp. TS-e1954]|nr:MAG: hypothetical protein M1828_004386 [Chrysothrix sp. TS-e1954]
MAPPHAKSISETIYLANKTQTADLHNDIKVPTSTTRLSMEASTPLVTGRDAVLPPPEGRLNGAHETSQPLSMRGDMMPPPKPPHPIPTSLISMLKLHSEDSVVSASEESLNRAYQSDDSLMHGDMIPPSKMAHSGTASSTSTFRLDGRHKTVPPPESGLTGANSLASSTIPDKMIQPLYYSSQTSNAAVPSSPIHMESMPDLQFGYGWKGDIKHSISITHDAASSTTELSPQRTIEWTGHRAWPAGRFPNAADVKIVYPTHTIAARELATPTSMPPQKVLINEPIPAVDAHQKNAQLWQDGLQIGIAVTCLLMVLALFFWEFRTRFLRRALRARSNNLGA